MGQFNLKYCFWVLILWMGVGMAQEQELTGSVGHAPEPYSAMAVFIADGTINLLEDFAGPDWPSFQRTVLERTDEEIEASQSEARAFFKSQFGVDVTDPAMEGRAAMTSYMIDPRLLYRATTITGRWVARAGTPVFDGGWVLKVLDPEGLVLGGQHSGQVAPMGSLARFGLFYVNPEMEPITQFRGKRTRNYQFYSDRSQSSMLINYQSPVMIEPNARGDEMFSYQLQSSVLGEGQAMGTSVKHEWEENQVTEERRTVLTFN